MNPFDNSPNPVSELGRCKQEQAEAYEFFAGGDPGGQALGAEALDKKYKLFIHVMYDSRYIDDPSIPPTFLALNLRKR